MFLFFLLLIHSPVSEEAVVVFDGGWFGDPIFLEVNGVTILDGVKISVDPSLMIVHRTLYFEWTEEKEAYKYRSSSPGDNKEPLFISGKKGQLNFRVVVNGVETKINMKLKKGKFLSLLLQKIVDLKELKPPPGDMSTARIYMQNAGWFHQPFRFSVENKTIMESLPNSFPNEPLFLLHWNRKTNDVYLEKDGEKTLLQEKELPPIKQGKRVVSLAIRSVILYLEEINLEKGAEIRIKLIANLMVRQTKAYSRH